MKSGYEYCVTAAGRVNLIGEHVDYCGGKVLPAALSLKNAVYFKRNGTGKLNLSWTDLNEKITLDLDRLEEYRNVKYANYIAGSTLMWQKAGHPVVGCDMLLDCSVPFGSGLSSSAAIEVSTIAALAVAAEERLDPVEIALTAQRAEREFTGVNCGIMDQYASACGKAGHAVLLDCATLEREYVPVDTGECKLVIINSNKPHNLVTSKYNERRAQSEQALKLLQTVAKIQSLADLSVEEFHRIGGVLSGTLFNRACHVVEECDRVRRAVIAMKTGDMRTFGRLLNESHASLRDRYEVTGEEMDVLAEAAQKHPACLGSRMTGGGFGGCTVSLVKRAHVADFCERVLEEYHKKTGYRAVVYETEISDGITVTKLS